MQKIITAQPLKHRIKTDALQVNDDWPGLFVRGDDALQLAFLLEKVLREKPLDEIERFTLQRYVWIVDKKVRQ